MQRDCGDRLAREAPRDLLLESGRAALDPFPQNTLPPAVV